MWVCQGNAIAGGEDDVFNDTDDILKRHEILGVHGFKIVFSIVFCMTQSLLLVHYFRYMNMEDLTLDGTNNQTLMHFHTHQWFD